MKALVYHGPGEQGWDTVPDPSVREATDVVVRVDTTTICGTDLHIMQGHVPAVAPGRVLGHEAVGTVVEIGSAVTRFALGDRVVVPAITSCGACRYCTQGRPSHCRTVGGIGWVLGHLTDGTQAEYVRVPYADTSVHRVPDGLDDEQVVYLCDIFPTAFETGVRAGSVRPGDVVVCLGAGPVGLAAAATAHLHGARRVVAVDLDAYRLDRAVADFGATHAVDAGAPGWQEEVRALCGPDGADVVLEAVGLPGTLEAAFELVRPYGHVANIGVHGSPVTLPIDRLWIENLTFRAGLVDGVSVPVLLGLVGEGLLDPRPMTTHRFALDDVLRAYEVFGAAAEHHALKVVLHR
jgi:alcohol dehydrogenase